MMNSKPVPALEHEEFYVGYLRSMPVGMARAVRAVVVGTLGVALLAAGFTALVFRRPAAAEWSESISTFHGRLIEHPYPLLCFIDAEGRERLVPLVAAGKRGAADIARGWNHEMVTFTGTTIERDGRLIIEIADGTSIAADSSTPPIDPPSKQVIGRQTIRGEVIDPKCFLGAMKPGDGKLHKGCAIRCIAGGIPPMLASRNPDSSFTYYLLADFHGRPANGLVLPYVAEQVELSGDLEVWADLNVFRIDPGGIKLR